MAKKKMDGELDFKKTSLAAGSVAAILYTLCAFLIAVLPAGSGAKLANMIFHGIDFSSIAVKNITLSNFLPGLIVIFIWGWLIGALFALVYNIIGRK